MEKNEKSYLSPWFGQPGALPCLVVTPGRRMIAGGHSAGSRRQRRLGHLSHVGSAGHSVSARTDARPHLGLRVEIHCKRYTRLWMQSGCEREHILVDGGVLDDG